MLVYFSAGFVCLTETFKSTLSFYYTHVSLNVYRRNTTDPGSGAKPCLLRSCDFGSLIRALIHTGFEALQSVLKAAWAAEININTH